jgi:hypothetical protein
MELFQYDTSDRRLLPIYIEQKIYLNGVYQLLPFDKNSI